MLKDNKEVIKNLLEYANNLQEYLLAYAKYSVLKRKDYERQIDNLAQLSINKGIDINETIQDIYQENKNEKIIDKKLKELKEDDKKEKNKKEIEIKNLSKEVYDKDFYENLKTFLDHKREELQINNIYFDNNTQNIANYPKNIVQIENYNSNDKKNTHVKNTQKKINKNQVGDKNMQYLGKKRLNSKK